MRLPDTAHTSLPWRIHELTRDFRLEDVWALPTPGGPDDFPRLVQLVAAGRPFAGLVRRRPRALGPAVEARGAAGMDAPDAGLRSRVPTLRDRLPEDLRLGPSGPDFDCAPIQLALSDR